MNQQISATKFR